VRDIQYVAPSSVSDAVALLSQFGSRARVLAGGTDLIVQMREHLREVDLVVDGKKIPELTALTFDSGSGLTLGAAVACHEIYENETVKQHYAGLVDAASIIGGTGIQGRASVGGNLCNSGPAADSTPILIAYGAMCRIAGADGEREVPVEEFCTAPGRNVLRDGELLLSLRLPAAATHSGAHYLRFIPRNEMDIAVVGVGAAVTLSADGSSFVAARVGLGAVAPTPLFVHEAGDALAGKPVSEESITAAAEACRAAARPIDDMRGSLAHRKQLAAVLTKRALWKAVERARA
jgi:CO/xanthine dehydrogenase FAD-binding subunit